MSLFSWFTSGPKAAEKVLDASIKGLDALVFTQEERAELNKKLGENWLELQKVLGNENTVRSVTRRIIAFAALGSYIVLVTAAAVAYGLGNVEYAAFLIALAEGKFGWLVLAIGGFYFGPHMLGRLQQKK